VTLSSNLRYRVVAIGDKYHWLDRKTNQSLNYKNGDEAQFDSLDESIAAFVNGKLTVEKNEVLVDEDATRNAAEGGCDLVILK